MAKEARKTNSDKPASGEPAALDLAEMYSFADLNPALEKLYSEMGVEGEGQSNVYISKVMQDGREAKIWNGQPADYDLMATARKFGSGDYRVKVYVQHESGRFVMRGNTVFPVMLEAGEDARIEALRSGQATQQQTTAALDPVNLARMISEAVKAVLPAPVAQPANNLGMLKEVAEIVRTLAPQQQLPVAPQFNPVDMLRMMADVMRSTREDDEPIARGVNATGTDVFLRLIDRFAPMFAQTLQNGAGSSALPAPGSNGSGQPIPPQNQPVQPEISKAEQDAMNGMKMGLAFLIGQAAADNDPETYADVVLDSVPEESIAEFLKHPQPIEYLAQFDPRVKQHAQWFNTLIEAVKTTMTDTGAQGNPVDGPGQAA